MTQVIICRLVGESSLKCINTQKVRVLKIKNTFLEQCIVFLKKKKYYSFY